MRPRPFCPVFLTEGKPFVRNQTDDLVWHQCQSRTLYADTDRSRVVYHANYLRYFEFGRASLMRDTAYPYREVEDSGFVYPIIELGVKYYTPLYYDDPMLIHTRPGTLERVKLQFDYVITHQETGEIICMGFTRHCAINEAGRPVGIDEKTVHLWNIFPQ